MKKFVSIGLLALALSGCGVDSKNEGDLIDCNLSAKTLYDNGCAMSNSDGTQMSQNAAAMFCREAVDGVSGESYDCRVNTYAWFLCWQMIGYQECSTCDGIMNDIMYYCT